MYNKISIDSIKYQLSFYLPEEDLDDMLIDELAMSCYRQIGHENLFSSTYEKGIIDNHVYVLKNKTFYKVKQAFVKPLNESISVTSLSNTNAIDTEEFPNSILTEPVPTSLWTNNLEASVSTVSNNIDSLYSVMYEDKNLTIEGETCEDIHTCIPSFKINMLNNKGVDTPILYSNVKEGVVLISMLEYDKLIEDDEELKQCIIKYVIAHIMLRKAYISMDYKLLELAKGLEKESSILMGKLKGKLNLPDENTLEHIRTSYDNIISTDKYKEGFKYNPIKLRHI